MNVSLGSSVVVAVAAVFWAAVAPAGQSDAGQKTVALSIELPDNPTAGARLFVEKGCVRCHALTGDDARVGPDLGRIHFRGTIMDLAGALWNHSPVMREKMQDFKIQPPQLSSREMTDLIAFLTAYRYYLTEVGRPGSASNGRVVFTSKGCSRCHGADAWDKLGPDLSRFSGHFSAIFLAQAMWNHGGEMAAVMRDAGVAWPKFAGSEMGDLLAFLQSGNGSATAERVYFEPGSPRRGRDLFASKRCVECHAIAGNGGKGGPDLGRGREFVESSFAMAGLMWNHSRQMSAEFSRRRLPRVTFSGQEMADILSYLYFVNYASVRGTPDRGGMLFVKKCSPCHALGGGTRVGPDLTAAPGLDQPIAIISAMWNHAAKMDAELHRRNLSWPRLDPGDAADLTAFLLSRRAPDAAVVSR
jgi:cytochrome c2